MEKQHSFIGEGQFTIKMSRINETFLSGYTNKSQPNINYEEQIAEIFCRMKVSTIKRHLNTYLDIRDLIYKNNSYNNSLAPKLSSSNSGNNN